MADRYLVATGNWNDTATWSDTSGGSSGASVPGASDNVFLDAASGAVTLTVNVSSNCLDLDCTGFTGTLAGSSTLTVGGSVFKLSSGMTLSWSGSLNLTLSSGTIEVTSAGKTIDGNIMHNSGAPGSTLQLLDKLTFSGSQLFIGTYSTFDANGQDVLFNGDSQNLIGAITFYNFERTPSIGNSNCSLLLSSNITVTNNLVLDSNSTNPEHRLLITSNTSGTQRTITCNGTVTANYCDFEAIEGAGSASWDLSAATGGSGDCGGNSDITFTTAVNCYQVGNGTYSFSDAIWFTTSGGVTPTRVPLPQDTAILDANSNTNTMTQNLQRIGSINCTGFTGTLATSTTCTCYGSITLSSGMTLSTHSNTYKLAGRGAHNLTCAGKTWYKNFSIDAPGGSYTLQDDWIQSSSRLLTLTAGTLDANDNNLSIGRFSSSNSNVRSILMGAGTWEFTAGIVNGIIDIVNTTNLTLNKGTSLVKLTGNLTANRTVYLTGITLYNFENATTGGYAVQLIGGPTFNNFKVAAGSKQQFQNGYTFTAATWELEGTSDDPITLASDTTTAAIIAKSGGGTVTAKYADIDYLNASPADTFFYDVNSTVENSSGWNPESAGGYPPWVFYFD